MNSFGMVNFCAVVAAAIHFSKNYIPIWMCKTPWPLPSPSLPSHPLPSPSPPPLPLLPFPSSPSLPFPPPTFLQDSLFENYIHFVSYISRHVIYFLLLQIKFYQHTSATQRFCVFITCILRCTPQRNVYFLAWFMRNDLENMWAIYIIIIIIIYVCSYFRHRFHTHKIPGCGFSALISACPCSCCVLGNWTINREATHIINYNLMQYRSTDLHLVNRIWHQ